MTDRWICARCYTSAEEALTACPNCGAPRGLSKTFHTADAGSAATPDPPDSAVPPVAPVAPVAADVPESSSAVTPTFAGAAGVGDGRWVCRRCFASNDGIAATCATCGLERGEEPPADAPGEFAAASAPAQAGSGGRRFPWRWVGFGAIALVVVGSTLLFAARRGDEGAITGAGDLGVQDLRVGDCFDLAEGDANDGGEVSEVRAIPCTEPHVYEVYVVAEYPSGELPSDTDEPYTAWEEDQCVGAFDEYVGISWDASTFWFSTLTPTDASWADGDRQISCFLHNEAETAVTGSAQGSAQ